MKNRKEVIKKAFCDLNKKGNFVLFSSANLWLQGIDIKPSDIDILSDDGGVNNAAIFFGSKVEKNEQFGYLETEIEIDGEEVHIVSNSNDPLKVKMMIETVEQDVLGETIRCATLQYELKFYKKIDRDKDKKKIILLEEACKNE